MSNIYDNKEITPQNVYNAYNDFIFSKDKRVFNKMTKRIELYIDVKEIFGDIVEFGVFKGAGLALWLKLREMYETNSLTKVIGFDYFAPEELLSDLSGNNQKLMTDVLVRAKNEELSVEGVSKKLENFGNENFILVKGDAVKESEKFYNENVGAKIKLLYMDLDLGEPTYQILKKIWHNLSVGGIIVCDEYGYHCWDETVGIDKFLAELDEKTYIVKNTNVIAPTLIIKKIK